MAKELGYLTAEDRRVLNRLLEKERKKRPRLDDPFHPQDVLNHATLNAVTKTATPVPADGIATVTICDLNWVAIDGYELDAHNPAQIEVPGDGTRLILEPGKGKDGTCQIHEAFLCVP